MAEIDLTASPNASWTTRQLRAWIRRATQDINREFYELQEAGVDIAKDRPLLYEQRNRLIELGTGREYKGGVGLGLTYKQKSQLILQARALRETYNIMEPPKVIEQEQSKAQKAYETFIANRPGLQMTEQEYKRLTEMLGAIGEHVFNEFGYESFIEVYDEARDEGKTDADILNALVQTTRDAKGEGWTTEDMIDSLRDNLGI